MRPDGPRDPYSGPDEGPAPPFPLRISGPVVKGFGRGSKDLGIPTANIPVSGLSVAGHDDLASGVYFGFAGLENRRSNDPAAGDAAAAAAATSSSSSRGPDNDSSGGGGGDGTVYPMVMSLGYNPFYGNSARSVEVHVMHAFGADFYGAQLKLSILGFIRPEYDYVSRDALVDDIRTDIDVARRSLERPAWASHAADAWLVKFDGRTEGTA